MLAAFSYLLVVLAVLLLIPVTVFSVEVLAAITLERQDPVLSARTDRRRRIAVLVPAHNESDGLLGTLQDIKAQLRSSDRVLVVADNSTDDTALVAKAAGAEVTERSEPDKIGKGYALAWGIKHLSSDPPEIVIVIDADCRLAIGTLDLLATACEASGHPVQARYLMIEPNQSPINHRVAIFAFRVKNWARPLGLRALNLPCQLMGTGMAFPWETINSIELATATVVEDLKLGLDLARVGKAPLFCPSAVVESEFPSSDKGANSQRKRWEKGHLGMIGKAVPRLIYESVAHGNLSLLALALDVAVPPLTLLGMLVGLAPLLSAFGVVLGLSSAGLIVSAVGLLAYIVTVLLCWWKFGRDILPIGSLFSLFSYVLKKIFLYGEILFHRTDTHWIRTDRDKMRKDDQ